MPGGPPATTRREKQERTRLELVAAANALFRERGYEPTSIHDITDRAGCSRRTFFRYFASKEDVAFGDAPERLLAFRDRLRATERSDGPLDVVCAGLREQALAFTDEPATRAIADFWTSEPVLRRRLAEFVRSSEDAVSEYLEAHLGDAPSDPVSSQVVATALCGVVNASLRLGHGDPRAVEEALATGFSLVVDGARGRFGAPD